MLLLLQKTLDKPGSAARPDGKISPKNFWVPYILYHNKWSKSIKKFLLLLLFYLTKCPSGAIIRSTEMIDPIGGCS